MARLLHLKVASLCFLMSFMLACAGHILQREHSEELLKTDEYDQKVKVVEVTALGTSAAPVAPTVTATPPAAATTPTSLHTGATTASAHRKTSKTAAKKKRKATDKGKAATATAPAEPESTVRKPEFEDAEGMKGRRPLKDPFRVGEKVSLALSYFNIVAGTMDVEVGNFVTVNGEKAYNFVVSAKSNSFFDHIYAVDDRAVTYMSYNRLVPFNLQISIKESKQLAETRTFFDWKTLRANYWQKKITQEHGETSKKLDWNIKDFSQNVISAAYYMRIFSMEPGKNLAFRVADEGKNIVFKGEVVRRERLTTEIGDLQTIVMRPTLTVDGVFTPVGEIMVWLTDDDRKFIVRIESKIKIGTLVAKIQALDKGKD